jgi:hypothetical protein
MNEQDMEDVPDDELAESPVPDPEESDSDADGVPTAD